MSIDAAPRTISSRTTSPEERIRLDIYADLRTSGADFSGFLEGFAYAVNNRVWEKLADKAGRPLTFRQFIEAPYPVGVGSTLAKIKLIVTLQSRNEVHPEVAEALASMRRTVNDLIEAPLLTHGGDRSGQGYNVIPDPPEQRGNTREYTVRRLKRDRPDLAELVVSGALSANAAAIQAGFRRRDTLVDTLRRAWAKLSDDERAAFLQAIGARRCGDDTTAGDD